MNCFASRIKHHNPAKVEPVCLDRGLEPKATALSRGTDTEGVLQKKKSIPFLQEINPRPGQRGTKSRQRNVSS